MSNKIDMPTHDEMFAICERLSGGQYAADPLADILKRVNILTKFLLSEDRSGYVKEVVIDE